MYKIVISAMLALLVSTSYGQVFKNVGLKAGVTLSKLKWEFRANSGYPTENFETDRFYGVYTAITADIIKH